MSVGITAFIERAESLAGAIIKHDPRFDFSDWAPRFLFTPSGQRFRWWPHQVDPARDMFNRRITRLSLRWYSGGGKTYMMGAGFSYAIKELREECGFMLPNQQDAEDWAKDQFMPIVEASPAIASLVMVKDIQRIKRWESGAKLAMVGANSYGRIRRLEASVLYADEIDALTLEENDPGDKLENFFKRSRGRKRQHHWCSSYPGKKGFSKIDAECARSDLFRRIARCVHCDHAYSLHTRQLVWPAGKTELAVLHCPSCELPINEEERVEMALKATYRNALGKTPEQMDAENYAGRRAYELSCMYHVGPYNDEAHVSYMHEIASEIEAIPKAENPEKSRRVFVNTRDAESYEEELLEKPEANSYYQRRENYNPYEMLPAGVLMLRASIDVQGNRLECEIVGFGENDETWGCGYRVIQGSPLKGSTWQAAWKYLATEFHHPGGRRLKVSGTTVDSGWRQDDVLKAIRNKPRVWATKGSNTLGKALVGRPSVVGRPPSHQWQIGTHEGKDLVYQRARLIKGAEESAYPKGYMHYPAIDEYGPNAGGEGSGYFEMLFAEDASEKKAPSGEWLPFYECQKGKRNEALDIRVGALVAARIYQPNIAKLKKWVWDGKTPDPSLESEDNE